MRSLGAETQHVHCRSKLGEHSMSRWAFTADPSQQAVTFLLFSVLKRPTGDTKAMLIRVKTAHMHR